MLLQKKLTPQPRSRLKLTGHSPAGVYTEAEPADDYHTTLTTVTL